MSDPGNTVNTMVWIPGMVCGGHGMYLFPPSKDDPGHRRCRAMGGSVMTEPKRGRRGPGQDSRRAVE